VKISQLWSYPVKSMIGERLDSIDLDTLGVVGDRAWAARDLERGGIRGAKKIGALMELAAADVGDGHVEITLPDGSTVRSTDADVDERLSAALEHPVRLEALRPATELDHYRRGEPDSDDFMAELRGVFGRLDDEPLPDLSVFPEAVLEYESPPGTYYDAYPLMVMTEQALSALASAVPGSVVDVRRFRPSFVIDAGDTSTPNPGHPEFDWVGRSARIGSAVVEFIAACPRCVMITRRIDDTTPQDRAVLRHVVRDLDQNVGVYANITTPGTINRGDSVTLI
jgi:uncharacterized protein YcbX